MSVLEPTTDCQWYEISVRTDTGLIKLDLVERLHESVYPQSTGQDRDNEHQEIHNHLLIHVTDRDQLVLIGAIIELEMPGKVGGDWRRCDVDYDGG